MNTENYVIRGGRMGRERLRLLSEVMRPGTEALLAKVGIRRGAACLDVGCGGGDVTRELARLGGSTGTALGVDLDAAIIAIARDETHRSGLQNVAFEVGDLTVWQPDQSFDVVYARFVLTHLADPGSLLARLRQSLRPGGVVVLEDIDARGHFAEPACAALDRFVDLYSATVRRRGADPNIGPRLPALLRGAGFTDVRLSLVHPVALAGGIKLLTCVTFDAIREAVLRDGLATEDELGQIGAALQSFASDPETVHGGPRVFQAWAIRA